MLCCGCATTISHVYGINRVYSGTRADIQFISSAGQDDELSTGDRILINTASLIDLPLSFVLDTVIFPITLPFSLFGETGEFRQMLEEMRRKPRRPHNQLTEKATQEETKNNSKIDNSL